MNPIGLQLLNSMNMKKVLCCALAALMVGPLSAFGRDTLIIGTTQFPAALHPNMESMLAKYYVLNATMRPITAYDADWELVCMLCTSIPTVENGGAEVIDLEDGRQGIAVTFTLRSDAFWGDGTAVSTRDVEYTIEVGKDPTSGVLNAEFYKRVLNIKAKDERTFTITYDRVEYDYNALSLYLLPEHLDREKFEMAGDYAINNVYAADALNPALYFGPYRISAIQHGSHVELMRNESWRGTVPAFDKVVFRTIENTAALEANLLSGSINYIAGALGLTPDQALAFQKRYPDQFDYIFQPGLIYEHIDLNLDNPILADLRVRRALLHAIDRKAISTLLFEGTQPAAHVYVSPLDKTYNPGIKQYAFDLAQANQLLDTAGWDTWVDGVRHHLDGTPLRLDFGTTAGSRIRETVQQVLQAQWRDAGIDVRIRNQPARVFFGEIVQNRRFGALAMYAWISSPETSPRATLHSTEIPSAQNNWTGSNYTGYSNPEMDQLIDDVEITLDPEKRQKLWDQIQLIYTRDLPVLPLYYRSNPYIIPKWLKGIEPTGNSSTTTLWIENWTVDE